MTLKNLFGAKIRLITGFPGTNDMSLSMVRGETDGFCGISYTTLKTAHADWLRDKSIVILLQSGHERNPELAGVPFIEDLTKDNETLQILRVITAPQTFALPFAAPPGTPADRVAALRDAFEKTMKDPDFLAEAKKMGQDVDPLSGDDVAKAVNAVYAMPPDILAKAAKAMASPQQ
jgi:tripartite-type tricarboxylate transporter receptor subunit TctC